MKLDNGEIAKSRLKMSEVGKLIRNRSAGLVTRAAKATVSAVAEVTRGMGGLSDASWEYERRRERAVRSTETGGQMLMRDRGTLDAGFAFGAGYL